MTSRELLRRHPHLGTAFFVVVVVMLLHESEHFAQVLQKDVRLDACPNDCRGLLGFFFDVEWVHVAYNHSLLVLLAALWLGFRMWRREWRQASLLGWTLLTGGIWQVYGAETAFLFCAVTATIAAFLLLTIKTKANFDKIPNQNI